MRKIFIFFLIVLITFSCKRPLQTPISTTKITLPKNFYMHLVGNYFNMPATIDITVIDTFAYVVLTYLPSYKTITAVVDNFHDYSFEYHLLQNFQTRDTVESWFAQFTSDSTLKLRVKIPIRDTTYIFVRQQTIPIWVTVFDTTVYYPNTNQELFIMQTNSLLVDNLNFHFLNSVDKLKAIFDSLFPIVKNSAKFYNPNSQNYFYPMNYNRIMTVEYFNNNLLVISDNYYQYFGGAHGLNGVAYYNIDVANHKILKLSDILDNTAGLKVEIYHKVSQKHPVLFVNERSIYLPENFYLRGAKLIFVYNIYEIAPYSEGQIEAEFSFKELKNRFKPDFLRKFYPNLKF